MDIDIEKFTMILNESKKKTIISTDRCIIIWSRLLECKDIEGDVFECGVYKGGSAYLIKECLELYKIDKELYLFDTFKGMPPVNILKDKHKENDFNDTSLDEVKNFMGDNSKIRFMQGYIPETFANLQNIKISFAHIDVDIFKSTLDCCEFIWPRLSKGGIMLFDDYGFESCPGAKMAVDDFFKDKEEVEILETKQALIKKNN